MKTFNYLIGISKDVKDKCLQDDDISDPQRRVLLEAYQTLLQAALNYVNDMTLRETLWAIWQDLKCKSKGEVMAIYNLTEDTLDLLIKAKDMAIRNNKKKKR